MKETNFIKQNQEKWNEFEEELNNNYQNPEKLSRLFIETTDDLSFSRTYYPNRSVRVYLNNISQKTFQLIYKKKKSKEHDFIAFWTKQLPNTLWHNRKQMMWAFIIFLLGLIVAVVSSIYDPKFATVMLGQDYIAQTISNIKNGDPLGIYSSMEPVEMFLMIAVNNIKVCFVVFLFGLFYGAGTVFILFKESIRVGAFMFFFYQQGLFEDAFFTVMLHGSIELSMIVLSGMAGMVLAKGLVFPNTFSRFQSFVSSAREGVMIMIAISLFLVLAAFIEGFATRHTDVSNVLRGLIILFSFGIVIGYFVIFPFYRYLKGQTDIDAYQEQLAEKSKKVNLSVIKENGQIFTDIFYYYKSNLKKHARGALVISALLTVSLFYIVTVDNLTPFLFDSLENLSADEFVLDIIAIVWPWDEINNFFNFIDFPLLMIPYVVSTFIILASSLFYFRKNSVADLKPWQFFKKNAIAILLTSIGIIVSLYPRGFNIISAVLLLPFLLLVMSTAVNEEIHWGKALKRSFALLKNNFIKMMGVFFYSVSIPWIVLISTSSFLWKFINEFIHYNIEHDSWLGEHLPLVVYSLFVFFLLSFVFPILIYGMSIFQTTSNEIYGAFELKKKIQNIGFKKRAYGLEKE